MAYGDYIHCEKCDCKLIYDGTRHARDSLDDKHGEWALLCPPCLAALQARVRELEEENKRLKDGKEWGEGWVSIGAGRFLEMSAAEAHLAAQGEELRTACLKLGKVRQAIDLAEMFGNFDVSAKVLRATLGE